MSASTTDGHVEQLHIGVFTTSSVLDIARGSGLLERSGLSVSVTEVKGSGEQLAGLADGTFDLIQTSPDNIMRARIVDGLATQVVFVLDSGLPQVLAGAPGISSVADLRGGVVGVDDPDSGFAFVVYELLAAGGLSLDDVTVSSVGSSRARLEALVDGSIGAGLLSASMVGGAVDRGVTVLARASDSFPRYPGVAVAALESTARSRAAALSAFAEALTQSLAMANDPVTRSEAVAALAAASGVSADAAAKVLDREAAARTAGPLTSAEAEMALAEVAGLRRAHTGVDPVEYFDPSFMRGPGG
ncbi:MAG: ABC transporter substrate-binding protein [Ilumatobacteraceae bacterium]